MDERAPLCSTGFSATNYDWSERNKSATLTNSSDCERHEKEK